MLLRQEIVGAFLPHSARIGHAKRKETPYNILMAEEEGN